MSQTRLAGALALALMAFAANSVLCRLALANDSIDAGSFTAIRVASGALLLALTLRQRLKLTLRGWVSAVMLFAYAACFSFAYIQLTAATGALLLFGFVQVTMFAGALVKGERLVAREWAGWAVAVTGLTYLVIPGLAAPPLLGAALMALAGTAWGVYSLLGKGNLDPVRATGENFVLAVPMAAVLYLGTATPSGATVYGVVLAIISGSITSALGYVLWYSVLPKISSVSAAIAQLTVPVLAAIAGVIVLSEPLSATLLVSALLTLGGVAIALYTKYRATPTKGR